MLLTYADQVLSIISKSLGHLKKEILEKKFQKVKGINSNPLIRVIISNLPGLF